MPTLQLLSRGTPYVVLIRNGQWWNTSVEAFEDYTAANWSHYAIAATQYGSTDSWYLEFPDIGIGFVDIIQFLRSGANPAETDAGDVMGSLHWNGAVLSGTKRAKL